MTAEALSDALTRQQEMTAAWVKAANDAKAALHDALIERDAIRAALMAAEARCAEAEEQAARERWEQGQVVGSLMGRLSVLRARLASEPHRMAHDAWCWRNHECPSVEWPVERSLRVAGNAPTIEAAFAFVINAIDSERITDPRIEITPTWIVVDGQEESEFTFAVMVDGKAPAREVTP